MANYNFVTTWVIDAPIEQVWDAIVDYKNLPSWWPSVAKVEEIEPGDSDGLGGVWDMTWETPLSYTITFRSTVIETRAPHVLAIKAIGEVEGDGRWELSKAETGTIVKYYWTVQTTKAWMNLLAVIMRPVLEWNHNATMKIGASGLSQLLDADLISEDYK
ncbi:Polyketide cyclase/dehydrase [Thalassoporum mexicanum PCC 7367]|uniref:SRPBCC family protein n=1 Tax=Thalassoporum mexicanum TaxID=3457544 RepID=UPI00029FBC3E|nr:SRPBCC family protein [Pseudanabaena sp. PCC 7367]AFY70407.1 Polyketide cyclase/dehydrase [Pseudanabaena sp. PCC 7367]